MNKPKYPEVRTSAPELTELGSHEEPTVMKPAEVIVNPCAKTEHDINMTSPTMAIEAITDKTDLPSPQVLSASLLPPVPTTLPPSINIQQEGTSLEQLELTHSPVVIFTNQQGTSSTKTVPLFGSYTNNRYEKDKNDHIGAKVYSIGTDPRCEVYFEKTEDPCIAGFHALIKIEKGQAFIKSKEGTVMVNDKPVGRDTWREIDSETDRVRVLPRSNKNGSKQLASRYLKISAEHPMFQEEELRQTRTTLRERAHAIQGAMKKNLEALSNGTYDPIAGKNIEQLATAFDELAAMDVDHAFFALNEDMGLFFRSIDILDRCTEREKKVLEEVRKLDEIRREIAERTEKIEATTKEEERKACELWEVDKIHCAPNENPLNKEEVHFVFRCPVYKLKKDGNKTKMFPMLIPSVDIGRNAVCHVELRSGQDAEPGDSDYIAEFAGKLSYKYVRGERIFTFKYLQPDIIIKGMETTAKRIPPPAETFRVTEGMHIYIGGYELTVDSQTHGFTYARVKDDILGTDKKPGIIDELFECIDDQQATTWQQDEEAHGHLQTIMGIVEASALPEEEKQLFRDKYEKKYRAIAQKLLYRIETEWTPQEPIADSGYFQTLLTLRDGEDENSKAVAKLIPDFLLRYEAQRRVEDYMKPYQEQQSSKSRKMLAKIVPQRWQKKNETAQETINPEAAVEVARFREFGLLDETFIEGHGIFTERVEKILKIRVHFNELDKNRANLQEVLELSELCNSLCIKDIFAAEEIKTRNLHIEVDVQPEGKVHEYLRKLCIFQARKAFKRLKRSDDPERIKADGLFINGLCTMGIMHKFELIDDVNEFISPSEMDAIIRQRQEEDPTADREELLNEIKTSEANELMEEKLIKAEAAVEAVRQAELAQKQLSEAINKAVKHVATIHAHNIEAGEKGMSLDLLKEMLPFTKVVFSPGLQKAMDDRTFDIHIEEIAHDSGKVLAKATPTRLEWPRIFKEWINRFNGGITRFTNRALISGADIEEVLAIVDYIARNGYGDKEEFEAKAQKIRQKIRKTKGDKYREEALTSGPTNFDYLDQVPIYAFTPAEDRAYYEAVKESITIEKLAGMLKGFRSKSRKERFTNLLKIKQLQKKDPSAIDALEEFDLTPKEKDLLQ